jgi:hypothetical protein
VPIEDGGRDRSAARRYGVLRWSSGGRCALGSVSFGAGRWDRRGDDWGPVLGPVEGWRSMYAGNVQQRVAACVWRISDSLKEFLAVGHRIVEVGRQYLRLTAGGGRAGGRAPCAGCEYHC